MNKQVPGSSAQLVERVVLALALLTVPLVFATGLSRYEVAKTALLGVLGSVLVVCWLVDLVRSGSGRIMPAGLGVIVAWLFLVYAGVSLSWSRSIWESLQALLIWTIFLSAFVSAASNSHSPIWVVLPLATSGLLVSLAVLLHRAGVPFPPDIPTGMAHDAGVHGTFDHALFAGTFLSMTAPLGLYLASTWKNPARHLGIPTTWLIAVAAGVTGNWPTLLAAGGLVLGGLVGLGHLKGRPGAWRIGIALVLSIAAALGGRYAVGAGDQRQVATTEGREGIGSLLADQLQQVHRMELTENAVTTIPEWVFEWKRVTGDWGGSRLIGNGVGTWAYFAGLGVDAEDEYYRQPRQEYHVHDRPPGFLLGVWVELGWVGLLLFVGMLSAALVAAWQGLYSTEGRNQPGAGFLLGAMVCALAAGLVTSAGYHAGEGVAIFALLGLGAQLGQGLDRRRLLGPRPIGPPQGVFVRFERWLLVGIPALAMLLPSLVVTARVTAGDYKRQQGELLFYASRNEQAISALESADTIWPHDPRTNYLLGTLRRFTPTDETRLTASRENYGRMAALRPHDIRFRLPQLRDELRRTAVAPEVHAQLVATLDDRLQEVLRLDPHNADAHRLLAELKQSRMDFEGAIITLLQLLEFQHDAREQAVTHFALGNLYENGLEQPQQALEHYLEADRLLTQPHPLDHQLPNRISYLRAWIEQGSRPEPPGLQ